MTSLTEGLSAAQALLRNAGAASGGTLLPFRATSAQASTDTLRKEVSDVSDAINALLRELSFSEKTREPLMAAVGFASGRVEEMTAPDRLIGARMSSDAEGVSDKALAKRWKRGYEQLDAEQKRTGYVLVERIGGGRDHEGNNQASRMRCPVVAYLADIIERARRMTDFGRARMECFELAARRVVQDMPRGGERAKDRFRRPRRDDSSATTREINTIRKLAKNIRKRADQNGATDDQLAELCALLRSVVAEAFTDAPHDPDRDSVHSLKEEQWTDGTQAGGEMTPPVLQSVEAQSAQTRTGGQIRHPQNLGLFDDARRAVEVFESVGASVFDVTMRDEQTEKASEYVPQDALSLSRQLERYLKTNADRMTSLIVRPRGAALIQIDDLSASEVERVRPFAFLVAETSTGNFQAWVALPEGTTDEAVKTIRRRLLSGVGADRGANGAMRWPGSINRKPARNAFRVRLISVSDGLTVTGGDLERAGLLAPEDEIQAATRPPVCASAGPRAFPSYSMCLASKQGNQSDADASFLKIAMLRGFSFEDAWSELERVAGRPKLNRDDYRQKTARFLSH